jgi:hypothetical protein
MAAEAPRWSRLDVRRYESIDRYFGSIAALSFLWHNHDISFTIIVVWRMGLDPTREPAKLGFETNIELR